MTSDARPGFEVTADIVEVTTAHGYRQWLAAGQDLPDWVDDKTLAELVDAGAVVKYQVI